MSESAPALRTVDLGRYARGRGPSHVLAGVELDLPPGRCLGLLGGNGAGKSTLFRMLAGLAPIGQGHAWLFGIPVPQPASRVGFAYLPEQPAVLEYLTGAEYLRLFGELEGLAGGELAQAIDRALTAFGLGAHRDALAGRYSKGMVQKLELARIFMVPRRFLLLDEPMTGLDSEAQAVLLDRLVAFKAEGGTLVLTAHEGELVEALCDELAILERGRLVRRGSLRELLTAKGWTIEVEPGSPVPPRLAAPAAGSAGAAVGTGSRFEVADRESADALLAELVRAGTRVRGFGPRTLKLYELLRSLGPGEAAGMGGGRA